MTSIWQDLRYATRTLVGQPAFATVTLLTLTLGIGGATAIFSAVHAVLLRPLPYHDESRIVMVWETEPAEGIDKKVGTPGNFQDWRAQTQTIEQLSALAEYDATMTGRGEPMRLEGRRVGASLFHVLGVNALVGRTFVVEDETPGRNVVMLSHHLWQQIFGGDPAIVGQQITLNDEPRTIVGVMGPAFRLPRGRNDFWIPMIFNAWERQARGSHWLLAIGRLKAGVTLRQAQADMDVIARGLAQDHPRFNAREGLLVEPIRAEVVAGLKRPLELVLAAVLIVMVIVSINVANLLLARSSGRHREIAVRLAMGASRARVVRQLLTESAFLAMLGSIGGIVLASLAVATLRSTLPARLTDVADITVNAPILWFAITVAVLSGLFFGLAPAVLLSRRSGSGGLNDATRGSTGFHMGRTGRALVTAEIALAVVLLVAGGLLLRSFLRLSEVEPGFRADSVLTFRIELPRSRYPDPAKWSPMLDELMSRLETMPQVTAAGAISWLPLTTSGGSNALFVEGRPLPGPGEETYVVYRVVTPGYFRALSIPLVAGRLLEPADRADAPRVVVVNRTMAQKYWPGEAAIGKRVSFAREPQAGDWMTVVGVVADSKQFSLGEPVDIEMFAPHTQEPNWFAPSHVAVRTTGDPLALASTARAAVRALDSLMPVSDVKTLEAVVAGSVAPARFNTWIVTAFAIVALVLAAVGVYGLLSFSVAARTREIGVRTALGAHPGSILRMVLRDGFTIVLSGLMLGIPAALVAGRLLQTLLFEIPSTDVVTFVAITALLTLAALAACYVPARRAAGVDPVEAMRE